jgi:mannose/cellobiose epimerase-like protein (N-acyl-D-glucosamine 2-epimerase family)
MNENDLRDAFAMFALAGSMMSGEPRSAEEIWEIADMMIATRTKDETDDGIATIKKRKYVRKN